MTHNPQTCPGCQANKPRSKPETHDFKCFRTTDNESLWASVCTCGDWISDIYLTRTEAKTAYVRHQTEWLKSLAKPVGGFA